jgi:hypothetical protein
VAINFAAPPLTTRKLGQVRRNQYSRHCESVSRTERPPRGGLSEDSFDVLITQRQQQRSASCATTRERHSRTINPAALWRQPGAELVRSHQSLVPSNRRAAPTGALKASGPFPIQNGVPTITPDRSAKVPSNACILTGAEAV